jgi:hypothetical protein
MIQKAATIRWPQGSSEYAEVVQEALSEKSRLLGRAMSYRDFTYDEVVERFGLRIKQTAGLFGAVAPRPVSAMLRDPLEDHLPMALAMQSESGRREFIVAPVLAEVRRHMDRTVSLFSTPTFFVDEEQGLTGFPDFLLTRSSDQLTPRAPVLVVIEAKIDDFLSGIPQCLAAMVAAQLFNRREGTESRAIHGVVTDGSRWLFMSLTGVDVTIDLTEYYINEVERLVGIMVHMLKAEEPASAEI